MNIAEHNAHIKSEYNRKRDKFISPRQTFIRAAQREGKQKHQRNALNNLGGEFHQTPNK